MSWPTRTWTVDGWKDFKTPGPSATPKGLPDDWKDHKNTIDNSTYWDVIENPLYEAAANAMDIDWEQWKADSYAEIGAQEDQEVRVRTRQGGRPTHGPHASSFTTTSSQYETMTVAEAVERGFGPDDWGPDAQTPSDNSGLGNIRGSGLVTSMLRDKDDEDALTSEHWGIGNLQEAVWGAADPRSKYVEDMNSMHEWLGKTIKTHALQDAPIIRRGPEGSDYGIDGDIWEHYGLDKPPAPPKEMDVNYEFNLIAAKPSSKSYTTPKGYPTLDTSTESIPYEDTHYAKWQTEQDKAYDKWEDKWGDTSYGEPTGRTNNTTNVQAEMDTSPAEMDTSLDDDRKKVADKVTEAFGGIIGASGFH